MIIVQRRMVCGVAIGVAAATTAADHRFGCIQGFAAHKEHAEVFALLHRTRILGVLGAHVGFVFLQPYIDHV